MALGLSDIIQGLGVASDFIGDQTRAGIASDANAFNQQQAQLMNALTQQYLDYLMADYVTPGGDRYYYNKDTGTRGVDLTPASQKLLDTMKLLEQANAQARQGDVNIANRARGQLAQPSPYTSNRITALLTEQGLNGLRQGYEPVIEGISRQLTRSGASGDAALGKIARNYGQDARDAIINAQLQGPRQFEALEGARTQRLGNQALQFGASGANKAGFTDINATGTDLMNTLANQNTYGTFAGLSGYGNAGKVGTSGTSDLIKYGVPSYGNLFTGTANLLDMSNRQQKNQGEFTS